MTTLLTKDIKRETLRVTDRKGTTQIVTLKAGDMLEFRSKGKRTTFEVPLAMCRNLALIIKADEEYKNKMDEYNSGLRKRKPKKPGRMFSAKWYQAIRS